MSGLRILFVLRAPLGGLFRQVIDLVRCLGSEHQIGIVADSMTGGPRALEVFEELAPLCTLGIHRMPMHRNPHVTDIANIRAIARLARDLKVDVMHGHGSKGGLYARAGGVFGNSGPVRAYTPHGGSFNYQPGTLLHKAYMLIESVLERGTDVFTFESRFIAGRFEAYVGATDKLSRVALNGLYPHEYEPRVLVDNPTDFVFIGELRAAKGIDLLLQALHRLDGEGRSVTTTIIGGGPDEAMLKAMISDLGIADHTFFTGPMIGAEGIRRGRIMVVPSRAESLPYIVLEAVGAQVPLVTTDCGGIPEIVGSNYRWMVPSGQLEPLLDTMRTALDTSEDALQDQSRRLADQARPVFNVRKMADDVVAAYRAALDRRAGA